MGKPKIDLDTWIRNLSEAGANALSALLRDVELGTKLDGTETTLHCYALTLDGNLVPRSSALAEKLAYRLVDYALPRTERKAALAAAKKDGTFEPVAQLASKAARLFSPSDTTGEPGEILLYLFAETYLNLPQLLCKMPLKTNAKTYILGIDGLHVGYDDASKSLHLYWAESKLVADFSASTKECLTDLKPFLCHDASRPNARERDLQLARDHLSDMPKHLEDAMLDYLDPQSASFQNTAHRGLCVIGFDAPYYPTDPNTKKFDLVLGELSTALERWKRSVKERVEEFAPLHTIKMEVFLLPLPSVQALRDEFILQVRNASR